MNLSWLARNLKTCWQYREGLADFLRRLLFTYSSKIPACIRRSEWTIGFSYPDPIGNVRLLLRSNAGADGFIQGEVFEHEYYRALQIISPSSILDLGANIGLTTIYYSRLFPGAQLACVEPDPSNLRVLARNLELNAVPAKVFGAAVDVQDGRVLMERCPMDYGHKIALPNSRQPTFEVAAISVATIMKKLAWNRIGLLKIDIEGHERRLLSENCEWLNAVNALCVEWHDEDARAALSALASRFGFFPPQVQNGLWFITKQ